MTDKLHEQRRKKFLQNSVHGTNAERRNFCRDNSANTPSVSKSCSTLNACVCFPGSECKHSSGKRTSAPTKSEHPTLPTLPNTRNWNQYVLPVIENHQEAPNFSLRTNKKTNKQSEIMCESHSCISTKYVRWWQRLEEQETTKTVRNIQL